MLTQLEKKVFCGLAGLYAGDAYGLPMEMMPREHVAQVFGRVEDLVTLDTPAALDGYWYRPIFPRGRGSGDTYFKYLCHREVYCWRQNGSRGTSPDFIR